MADLTVLSREELIALILQMAAQIALLEQEVERQRKSPPSGAAPAVSSYSPKANKPKRARKKRNKGRHHCGRKRQEPTRTVDPIRAVGHAVETCPDCSHGLKGGWVHRVREVIDLPDLPVEITHHRIIGRHCGVCQKNYLPKLDLSSEVVGQHRIGIRLMSLIAHMRVVCRMPVRTIQAFLKSTYSLHVSNGEIVNLLNAVAKKGETSYAALKEGLRSSSSVNADETGFRQDGVNGQIWVFCTPTIRYFKRDPSRSHAVPQSVRTDYNGVICSDFYAGYNYHLGEHQRCWSHYLRTLHELKTAYPDHKRLIAWAAAVHALYKRACDFKSDKRRERVLARGRFQHRLEEMAKPWVDADVPFRNLARRIINCRTAVHICRTSRCIAR